MRFFATVVIAAVWSLRASAIDNASPPPPIRMAAHSFPSTSCAPFVSGPVLVSFGQPGSATSQVVNEGPYPYTTPIMPFQVCPPLQSLSGCPINGHNGLIFALCSSGIVATDATSGLSRWQTSLGWSSVTSITLSGKGDVVFALGNSGGATVWQALDAWTGSAKWSNPVASNRTTTPVAIAVIAEPQTLVLLFTDSPSRVMCLDSLGHEYCSTIQGTDSFSINPVLAVVAFPDAAVTAQPQRGVTIAPRTYKFATVLTGVTTATGQAVGQWDLHVGGIVQRMVSIPLSPAAGNNVNQIVPISSSQAAVAFSGGSGMAIVTFGEAATVAKSFFTTKTVFGLSNTSTSAANTFGVASPDASYVMGFTLDSSNNYNDYEMFAIFTANLTQAWTTNVTSQTGTSFGSAGGIALLGASTVYWMAAGMDGFASTVTGDLAYRSTSTYKSVVPQYWTFDRKQESAPQPWAEMAFSTVTGQNVGMRLFPLWWKGGFTDVVNVLRLRPADLLVAVSKDQGLTLYDTFSGTYRSSLAGFQGRTKPVTSFNLGNRIFVGFRDESPAAPSSDILQVYDVDANGLVSFTTELLMPYATTSFGYKLVSDPADASVTPDSFTCVGNLLVKVAGTAVPSVSSVALEKSCTGRRLTVTGGNVIIADVGNTVYSIAGSTPPTINWKYDTELVAGDPVQAGGIVWLGSSSGTLTALSASNGGVLGRSALLEPAAYPIVAIGGDLFVTTLTSLVLLNAQQPLQQPQWTGARYLFNWSTISLTQSGSASVCVAVDEPTQLAVATFSDPITSEFEMIAFNLQYRTKIWSNTLTSGVFDCSALTIDRFAIFSGTNNVVSVFTGHAVLDYDYPLIPIPSQDALVAFSDGGLHYTKAPRIPLPSPFPGVPSPPTYSPAPWYPYPSLYTVAGFAVAVSIGIIILCVASVILVLRSWRMQHAPLLTDVEEPPATEIPHAGDASA